MGYRVWIAAVAGGLAAGTICAAWWCGNRRPARSAPPALEWWAMGDTVVPRRPAQAAIRAALRGAHHGH